MSEISIDKILSEKETNEIINNIGKTFFNLHLCEDKIILAGGVFKSGFDTSIPVKDFDIYFLDENIRNETVEKFQKDFKFELIDTITTKNYNTYTFEYKNIKIQLIGKIYETIEDIFNNFDFYCCMFAYDGDTIYTTKKSYEDMVNYNITLNNIDRKSKSSLKRMFRYMTDYGFEISEKTMEDFVDKSSINIIEKVEDENY